MTTENTNTTNQAEANDTLFEEAVKLKGYASLEEFAKVSGWLEDVPGEAGEGKMVPKPEFKEKYEAWLLVRRRRLDCLK